MSSLIQPDIIKGAHVHGMRMYSMMMTYHIIHISTCNINLRLIRLIYFSVHHFYITTCYIHCSTYSRGKEFRTAFQEIHTLKAYFPSVPFAALSGTLTTEQLRTIPSALGLHKPVIIEENPDRPNIFLEVKKKPQADSTVDQYEGIYITECDKLFESPSAYPVTLMYLPLEWCAEASSYCEEKFGGQVALTDCRYGVIFSRQVKVVLDELTNDLKKDTPRFRLLLYFSSWHGVHCSQHFPCYSWQPP